VTLFGAIDIMLVRVVNSLTLKAAREGHKEISELLINNGADLNAKNIDGKTPSRSMPLKTIILKFPFSSANTEQD
jgi:hypothetical protein